EINAKGEDTKPEENQQPAKDAVAAPAAFRDVRYLARELRLAVLGCQLLPVVGRRIGHRLLHWITGSCSACSSFRPESREKAGAIALLASGPRGRMKNVTLTRRLLWTNHSCWLRPALPSRCSR